MDLVLKFLGQNGVILAVGVIFFVLVYKNSVRLFSWIEYQTLGTRDYILERLNLLFIEVKPERITILLLLSSFGTGIFVLSVFGLFGKWIIGALAGAVFGFLGWKIPRPIVNYMVEQRMKKYQNQVVDALNLLGNGIRAGLSVPQSLAMVVDELPPPISQEFNLILQQNKIGVPLEECFENLLKRVPSEDNEMFVTSVNVLRETGGNLAETFETIVSVIRERIRVQQKIDTMIASNKFQGIIVSLMPAGLTAMFAASDPESMSRVFTHPLGIIMLLVAIGLNITGAFVIVKISKIDI